jgi:predicted dienelactone hydrolase
MPHLLRPFLFSLAALATWLAAAHVHAHEAGWMQIQTAGATPDAPTTTVALYYPTLATPRAVAMGPFALDVAIGGKPLDQAKALIVLSHGISGTELGHSTLAQALARSGYVVAALRHPGDNWQDRSLLEKSPERYFDERPRQASRVIDAILADPAWQARLSSAGQPPRVGALGHSAGGYTVLALAGAVPDALRLRQHCQAHVSEDPLFCSLGQSAQAAAQVTAQTTAQATAQPPAATSPLKDGRVRAVVALAPTGVLLSADSLATVTAATLVYQADLDRFLVPRFHAQWVASQLPAAKLRRVPNAWHFAFMDTPSLFITSPDGDVAANPPGFDRAAFLQQLAVEITAFFDQALQ